MELGQRERPSSPHLSIAFGKEESSQKDKPREAQCLKSKHLGLAASLAKALFRRATPHKTLSPPTCLAERAIVECVDEGVRNC